MQINTTKRQRFVVDRNNFILMLLCCLLVSNNALAAIGAPRQTAKIGYAVGASQLHVKEPDGSHSQTEANAPFNFLYSDWLPSGNRYLLNVFYLNTSTSASSEQIGQNIQSTGVSISLQKNVHMLRWFSPWLGMGVQLSRNRFYTRHTVTDDGFLLQQFPDRQENSFGFVINAASEWEIEDNWHAGLLLENSVVPGYTSNQTSGKLFFLFRLD